MTRKISDIPDLEEARAAFLKNFGDKEIQELGQGGDPWSDPHFFNNVAEAYKKSKKAEKYIRSMIFLILRDTQIHPDFALAGAAARWAPDVLEDVLKRGYDPSSPFMDSAPILLCLDFFSPVGIGNCHTSIPLLHQYGADINAENHMGRNVLWKLSCLFGVAVDNNPEKTFELHEKLCDTWSYLVAHGADPLEKDIYDSCALEDLITSKHRSIGAGVRERLILMMKDIPGRHSIPLLDVVARNDNGWPVQHLLADGFDPNGSNPSARTPLSWAAENGNIEMLKSFLDAGADPNQADFDGRAALFFALERLDVVNALLDKGADPRVLVDGLSLITWAMRGGHGAHRDYTNNTGLIAPPAQPDGVVLRLLDAGAPPHTPDDVQNWGFLHDPENSALARQAKREWASWADAHAINVAVGAQAGKKKPSKTAKM